MKTYLLAATFCAGLVATWPIAGHAREGAPAVEIFVGGSKLWEHAAGRPDQGGGAKVAVTGRLNRSLGWETDVSVIGYLLPSPPAYGDYFRFLAGPHFAYNAKPHVRPFTHVLVGLTHGRQFCGSLNPPPDCNIGNWVRSGNAFTAAIGGGLDVKVFRFCWLRPIQADYVHVFFPRSQENNLQLSFGFTFRFGGSGKAGEH